MIDVDLNLVPEVRVIEGVAATTGEGQDHDHVPQHVEKGSVYMHMEQL